MSGESDTFEPVKDVSSDESDTFEPVQDDLSGERLTRPPRGRILSGESGSKRPMDRVLSGESRNISDNLEYDVEESVDSSGDSRPSPGTTRLKQLPIPMCQRSQSAPYW